MHEALDDHDRGIRGTFGAGHDSDDHSVKDEPQSLAGLVNALADESLARRSDGWISLE